MNNQTDWDAFVEALFALLLAALFGYAVFVGSYMPYKAALFPTIVGIPGIILALAVSVLAYRRGRNPAVEKAPPAGTPGDLYLDQSLLSSEALRRTVIIFGWIFGTVVGGWLLGQKLALPLFVFAYLKLGSREGWLLSILMTLATIALLLGVFDYVVSVAWYEGEVFQWLGIEPL